jgi:GTPase SAR1 family protein
MKSMRILLLGDANVGKTHFIQEYLKLNKKKCKPTVGCDVHVQKRQEQMVEFYDLSG